MSININIEEILIKFANEKRIFQKEAQLQFELAWELQKQIERNNSGAKVYLEFLGYQSKKTNKRFYSDIIIIDKDDNYIVIELKYKTKKADFIDGNNNHINLFGHNAPDDGRYDYLLDIHRIELFKYKDENSFQYSNQLQNFEKGYAILLTNENQYWNRTRENAETTNSVDKFFSIGQKDVIGGTIRWNTDQLKKHMQSRPSFVLKGSYECKWTNYCTQENKEQTDVYQEFKYLITKIENDK